MELVIGVLIGLGAGIVGAVVATRFVLTRGLATAGSERLSPAFHALGGRHSFEVIRLVRLMKQ